MDDVKMLPTWTDYAWIIHLPNGHTLCSRHSIYSATDRPLDSSERAIDHLCSLLTGRIK